MTRRVTAFVLVGLLMLATATFAGTITVPPGGDLQAALNQAQPGDTILLAAGATFTGNFVLPAKSGSGYITIRSDAPDSSLPADGQRIGPSYAGSLPKLQAPAGAGGAPPLATAPYAAYYIIRFVEFLPNPSGTGSLLALGSAESSQNSLAVVPHDIVVDRCYLHGVPGQPQLRGIALNSAQTTIKNSYISEIKYAGSDSQAIAGWNGPGPYSIVNNYLEAAGENLLIGGSSMFIPNVTPSNIEIRNNYLTKQTAWRGSSWDVKNIFELKHAQDVIVDGNVFEYNWQAAQPGYAIVITPRNQYGDNLWTVVQRVSFTNNIVRHVSSAWNLLGWDDEHQSQQTNHITFRNNVLDDVSSANWGGTGRMLLISQTPYVTVDHNTVFNSDAAVYAYNGPSNNFVFTNNIVNTEWYGITGDSTGGSAATAISMYFPGGSLLDNVFVKCSASGTYPAGNYFAADYTSVGFANLSGGDYHLGSGSPYKAVGTDGKDAGADIDALNGAQASSTAATGGATGGTTGGTSSPTGATPPPASNVPAPWSDADVGAVGVAGSATGSGGAFTVSGAGADIWGTADAFNYVYQPLNGDGQIVARVASLQNTSPVAKAGVMIREALDAGASNVIMDLKAGGGTEFMARTPAGAPTAYIAGTSDNAPAWVKLVRSGATITGYTSADGSTWTAVGTATVAMAGNAYIGLAVTSISTGQSTTATFDNVAVGAATSTAGAAAGGQANVWLTTADGASKLAQQSAAQFGPDSGSNPLTIDVDAATAYQQMDGFGASFTDSSAWLVYNKLSVAARTQLMTQLFDRASGIGLSFLRQPIGASDFALGNYTYDDMPAGQTDAGLANFSIDHDRAYILPVLQQAMQINPALQVMGTPWSPPAWMKSSGSVIGGSLNSSAMGPYANYLVKFIQAYQAAGIPVARITPQNEPHYTPTGYPGMYMESNQEADFVKNYLGPALASAGLKTTIAVWDHNWDDTSYAQGILGDPAANALVSGSAWHCYGGAPSAMSAVHDAYPGKDIYLTECTAGAWSTNFGANLAWDMENLIIGGARNWARSITKWNIALDTSYGPQNGGCTNCTGLVTIDQATGGVTFNEDYYSLGHIAKFVVPGAHRVASNSFGPGNLEDVAFVNPDGSRVAIVLNASGSSQTFKLREGGQSVTYTLPAGAVATFTWTSTTASAAPGSGTPTPNTGSTGSGSAGGTGSDGATGSTTSGTNQSSAWTSADVGSVGLSGSLSTSGGTFTIAGAGADIWATSDAFHYVYQALTGDGEIRARVLSMQNTDTFAKAGVMIRAALDAGASQVTMDVRPDGGAEFLSRLVTGGETTGAGSAGSAPVWVRLVREGTTIKGYTSADGNDWTQVGNVTVSMGATVYIGLAATSHTTSQLMTATFDSVVLSGAVSAASAGASSSPSLSDQDVGNVGLAGSASYSAGAYTVRAAGADIWGSADSFHFAYQALDGDGEIRARVLAVQNTDVFAKAGVMIRESLDAAASEVTIDVKPDGGVEFLSRIGAGQQTTGAGATGGTPIWIRLVREGTTVKGYTSADGNDWTQVGSVTVGMASNVYVGLAVCSHNTAVLNTAVFDGVAVR